MRDDRDSMTQLLQSGYRFALSLTHERGTAEDLLQDAWVAVLQARGPHNRQYLFTAIRTRFLNRHRRERLVSVMPLEEAHADVGVDDGLDDQEFPLNAARFDATLAQLRPLEREALYLSAVEEYSAQEIAQLTKQSRGTVLSLIHRARQKLRRAFHATGWRVIGGE